MIKYFSHQEIDKAKWNICVEQSVNSLIYAYSWYLDIVSPRWEALILNDYEAVFPLTHGRKIFSYLYQPFFTQQLGLFYKSKPTASLLNDFLNAIPEKYRFMDIQLNEANEPDLDTWNYKKRKNFLLQLNQTYQKLYKNFSGTTKRNIKKATGNDLSILPLNSDEAVDFYIKHKGNKTLALKKSDYVRLKELLKTAEAKRAMLCYGVYHHHKELVSMAVILSDKGRLYMIHNCASEKGRKLLGMYFLVDHLIHQHADQSLLLDFEGSDMDGIARFNKGFGAHKQPYFRLRINRLPWYIKWLKY